MQFLSSKIIFQPSKILWDYPFEQTLKWPFQTSELLQFVDENIFFALSLFPHRINDDRIENSLKGRRKGNNLTIYDSPFAASIFKVHRLRQYCISTTVVMLAGLVLPWRTLQPPPFPTPGQAWGIGVVGGCARGCRGGGGWGRGWCQSPDC